MYLWNSPYLAEKTTSPMYSLCIDFVPLYDKKYKTYPKNFRLSVALPWQVAGSLELEEWMLEQLRRVWMDDEGQDIAEYAVMLAVILVIVVGTIRLIGSNANNVFSNVASSLSQ
jgi:Flp pilus assembly pilin Flp